MKFNKKHLILVTLLVAGSFVALRLYKDPATNATRQPIVSTKTTIPAQEHFLQKLQTELDNVWTDFEKIGINKQRYEQTQNEYRERYLRTDYPNGNQQISAETKQFVQGILKEFGINPNDITLVGWNDISPAGASEKVMYINEKEFNSYSPAAKRFLIGHEIQHILHKDNFSRYTLELLCKNEVEKMAQQKDHPLCQYNRFKERRADVKTAIKGQEWAQGYLEFTKDFHKRAGNNPGITHPLIQDRIALAQDIVQHMKYNPQIA